MNKKKTLMTLLLSSAALAGIAVAQADAANSVCSQTVRLFPGNNVTDTVAASCQHTSAGRGTSSATFTAKNQNGTKTVTVSKSCCTGAAATIQGLDSSSNPLPGCTVTVTSDSSSAVVCNAATRWKSTLQYFE